MGSEVFEFYVDKALAYGDVASAIADFFSIPRDNVVEDMWSDDNLLLSPRVGVKLDDIGGSFRTTVGILTDFEIEPSRYPPLFAFVAASINGDVLADDLGRYATCGGEDRQRGQWLLFQPDGGVHEVVETSGTENYEVRIVETLQRPSIRVR